MMYRLPALSSHTPCCVHSLVRRLPSLVVAISAWGGQTAAALGADDAAAEGGKSYGVPWLVIVLAVALGVFITLRPAGRSAEIKRDLRADL